MKELINNDYKNIVFKISWDESGIHLIENVLNLLIVKKLSDGFIIPKSLIHIHKENGAYRKEDVCISCSEYYNPDFLYSVFLIIKTPKLKFFNIEFLRILIEFENNEYKDILYDKKLSENQNGNVLHIGNIRNGKFESIFDYIDSPKIIEKEFKISLKNNPSKEFFYNK